MFWNPTWMYLTEYNTIYGHETGLYGAIDVHNILLIYMHVVTLTK